MSQVQSPSTLLPKTGKVLILGLASSSLPKGFDGSQVGVLSSLEVWTLNDWYQFYPALKKPDVVFNLHSLRCTNLVVGHGRFPSDWQAQYNDSGAKIVVNYDLGVADQIPYPLSSVRQYFRGHNMNPVNCSISAMLSLAVVSGYRNIVIRGVRLHREGEYEYQFADLRALINYIRNETGIKIDIDFECAPLSPMEIFKTARPGHIYGEDIVMNSAYGIDQHTPEKMICL